MNDYGYGVWAVVVFNSLLLIVFAASFFHPKTSRDWRALGGFSAFVVALFTEMYGEPAKLVVALLAVAAAVALVLPLTGLRRGMGEQMTTYLKHQPAVVVGQAGARDFLSQTFVSCAAGCREQYER